MSTILMRSALAFHGHDPAPEVHSVVVDRWGRHVVTWAEVMRKRRERQAIILSQKRETHPWRAYRLWVAYFDQDFFGGWHAFLDDFRGHRHGRWLNQYSGPYRLLDSLMGLFPCGLLPIGESHERERRWLPAFAETYRRGTHHRRPRGCVYLWWNGRDEPRRITSPPAARTAASCSRADRPEPVASSACAR